jgi:tetratricopeptide (TPR) repeat protein
MEKKEQIFWQVKLMKNKNWIFTKNLLEDAIKEYPKEKKLYSELGHIYYSKQLFRRAIEHFHKALMIDPADEDILFHLGNCFLSLGEFKVAADYYNDIHTNSPELLYNKAYAHTKLGDLDAAIEHLEKLLDYNIGNEIPYTFIAELYITRKKFKQALYYLAKAEKKFGSQSAIHYMKALAYSSLQQWATAYIEFKKIKRKNIQSALYYRSYGICCEKVGKTEAAIDSLIKSLKYAPNDALSFTELISIYIKHDRMTEAYNLFLFAKKRIPFSREFIELYYELKRKLKGKMFDE